MAGKKKKKVWSDDEKAVAAAYQTIVAELAKLRSIDPGKLQMKTRLRFNRGLKQELDVVQNHLLRGTDILF